MPQPLHIQYGGRCSYTTVIPLDGLDRVTKTWLQQVIETYRSGDDVFCDDFLDGVIFIGNESTIDFSHDASDLLKSPGTTWIEFWNANSAGDAPPPGPYLTFEQHLLEVFRLYDDIQGAFMSGIVLREHW